MGFDRFTILVVLRVLLILASLFLLTFLWFRYDLFFTYGLLAVVLLIQTGELIHYVHRTNRDLGKFLEAIKYGDYAVTFAESKLGKSFRGLNENFSTLMERLKENKASQQSHAELLSQVLEHVKVGVLVIEKSGKVMLMNASAQQMLEVPHFHNWEMFEKKKPAFAAHLGDFNFEGRKLINLGAQEFYLDLHHIELLGQTYRLLAFSDLKNEIEQKEIEAWHKLIRILAHEVMNSVTPISSLSETVQQMLTDKEGNTLPQQELHQEKIEDIREALKTIVRRSRGMLSFVDEYRKLTKLPAPRLEAFNIRELFEEVWQLMKSEAEAKGIDLQVAVVQPRLALRADRKMVEQVLINLIGNSFYALEEQRSPRIRIEALPTEDHLIIEVSDNGKGIPEEVLPSIFIPFFSTRKNGSGIGLTLSKNIMKLHRGNITVESKPGEGTRFRLIFEN